MSEPAIDPKPAQTDEEHIQLFDELWDFWASHVSAERTEFARQAVANEARRIWQILIGQARKQLANNERKVIGKQAKKIEKLRTHARHLEKLGISRQKTICELRAKLQEMDDYRTYVEHCSQMIEGDGLLAVKIEQLVKRLAESEIGDNDRIEELETMLNEAHAGRAQEQRVLKAVNDTLLGRGFTQDELNSDLSGCLYRELYKLGREVELRGEKIAEAMGRYRGTEPLIEAVARLAVQCRRLQDTVDARAAASPFVTAAIKVTNEQTDPYAVNKIALLAGLCEELGVHCFAYGWESEDALATELNRLKELIDSPHNADWFEGVRIEAAHQHERWGSKHDDGKEPEDWLFLAGYLAGKGAAAQKAGDIEKAKHHTISAGAAMLNWHRRLSGELCGMRPGITISGETDGNEDSQAQVSPLAEPG